MNSSSGREVSTGSARIAGVVSCVPRQRVDNTSFVERFGQSVVNDVTRMVGVHARHHVAAGETTRDLCRAAGSRLVAALEWAPESIDAIIFVSQSPDFRLPATACALHADWGAPAACIAFDVNLGCSGYPYGLWLAHTMVQSGAARRVLLAVGDTSSRMVDPNDRGTAMLFGDAGCVTAIEHDPDAAPAHFIMGSDGAGVPHLVVPQGCFRDHMQEADPRLDGRDPTMLFMDGGQIFNFALRAVPPLLARTAALAQTPLDDYDAVLFHQANLFMLKHLAKKCGLDGARFPINIDRYGNTSSASIPLLMTTDIAPTLRTRSMRLAMLGFGVGYSWASASLSVGPLNVCETIEH
jgi:3-oxoacyl-[acyl-carrier-protein] synthase-3